MNYPCGLTPSLAIRALTVRFPGARIAPTSRLRREFGYRLLTLQGFALRSPLEGFGHGAVEVIDQFKNAGFQLNFTAEIGTSE